MNNYPPKLLWLNNSGLGCLLNLIVLGLLFGAVGLGWVVNGFLILLGIIIVTPAIAFWVLRWWVQRNLVEDQCPVCSYEFTGFNNTECRCPNCGEALQIQDRHFQRITPPGTIDVEAIDVSVKQIEDRGSP
ncbi:hypothetical protein [Crocosphaera sp. XPORK-15E]|uniref:hypothetical protein n=1 Tax=Crocosphaera sp. XPORK-15E TaxID=3110247 RepID=UPI002B2128C1|nr:hypothetical protein [Crocosphaera sp. XPORK-15E]MEA5535826.1 hypothetical protein [Crocosphaera sp. XPORK-15E]